MWTGIAGNCIGYSEVAKVLSFECIPVLAAYNTLPNTSLLLTCGKFCVY